MSRGPRLQLVSIVHLRHINIDVKVREKRRRGLSLFPVVKIGRRREKKSLAYFCSQMSLAFFSSSEADAVDAVLFTPKNYPLSLTLLLRDVILMREKDRRVVRVLREVLTVADQS